MGERLAIYDRETGLLAYWYFSLRMEEEVVRCGRYGQTFSLLLLEAQTGRWASDDEKALFKMLGDSFRDSDLVAHLGNLRFIVLMTSTDAPGAMVVQERLEADEQFRDISVGLASFPADGENSEQLLAALGASADLADSADATDRIEPDRRKKPGAAA
jgi:GGDEF domain-containing protein